MLIQEFALNTLLALVLGATVGMEREIRRHIAGLKTNALVSVGAALYVGLSLVIEGESSPTRIAAQVVSGLGFLGGGVILRDGFNVHGLNTAATVWCSGAIGSLAGAGFVWEAIAGTLAILLTNLGLYPVTQWINRHWRADEHGPIHYQVTVSCEPARLMAIRAALLERTGDGERLLVKGIATSPDGPTHVALTADLFAHQRIDSIVKGIVADLLADPTVASASWRTP